MAALRIEGLVRALRVGDDAATAEAARALGDLGSLTYDEDANRVLIAEAGGIPPLVEVLRNGSAWAKRWAARALAILAGGNAANKVAIAAAGAIPPLVQLLREGNADAKCHSAVALGNLAFNNAANKVAIADAGGVPPLVDLLRDGIVVAKYLVTRALGNLASNNAANAVAIAVTVGFDAVVELARRGRVTVDDRPVWNAGVPAKRKAALVVAKLLRDYVPRFQSAPGDIKAAIASFL